MANVEHREHEIIWQDEPLVTKSQWKDILHNKEITHELDFKTILVIYNSPQNRTTATDIAEKLREKNYHIISSGNVSFSRRICKNLNIKPPKNSDGGNRWWTIPYWGAPTGDGKYFFILRPELKEAIEELVSEGKLYNSYQERSTDPFQDIEEFMITSKELSNTEREANIKNRIGQEEFRTNLIKYWKNCSVTGCELVEILKASHIKPWHCSDNRERLDMFNGLLLIPNLDSVFDDGLISFDNEGKILLSNLLDDSDRHKLGIHPGLSIRKIEANHIKYLEYHRRNIFRQN
ncbi:MAG: HNH endonuclease [Desulfosporosinus sp.]